ncbi:Response regulator receiver domain-containing protein [Salinihabitans flavidus]|uniref:Response regulator receiver domain-containing protein n=1 Tax=Salinihabitans flavidus TaxID=569882 RepID=A0A1H8VUC4_9RHOB|nr:response regulator [Salinihabitans flavidus]SEP18817.1 Response regulator receiver domain-containing protein [Salinihabitans flavidus]
MSDPAKLLVVDDDQMMLDYTVRVLTSLGHSAVTATDAEAAVRWLEQDQHIRAAIIDLRLGKTSNGAQLALQALAIRPDLRVLLTSGDPGSLQVAGQDMPLDVELLPKPYRRRDLVARLSRLL